MTFQSDILETIVDLMMGKPSDKKLAAVFPGGAMLGAFTAGEIAGFSSIYDLIQLLPQYDGDLDVAYNALEEIQNDPLKAEQAQIKGN
ncbi:MAG: hypothetical protein WC464_07590, partial [Bdellovibrionales bacterium]